MVPPHPGASCGPRWDHDGPPQAIKGRSCHVALLRRACCPRASQALLYCCVPVVPGPAAVVARPAATSRLVATNPECVRRLKAQRVRCHLDGLGQAPEVVQKYYRSWARLRHPPHFLHLTSSPRTGPRAAPEQAGGPLGRWVAARGAMVAAASRGPRPPLACGITARRPRGRSRGRAAGRAVSLGSSLVGHGRPRGHTR